MTSQIERIDKSRDIFLKQDPTNSVGGFDTQPLVIANNAGDPIDEPRGSIIDAATPVHTAPAHGADGAFSHHVAAVGKELVSGC